ncbi:MAG: UDP-N-acetylmuramoyl-tripeptide--D-alanyl-D-alanine ligase, partial [Bacteroidales bacterium]|nr:UDP-N-acetylmuramoyl-tripeptide--D-alanyl-D-alanine ligase [Bacteroidales bacterium]
NANPSSMEEALRNFSRIPAERAFPVLGDMCELGRESLREHEKVVQLLQTLGFSMAFLYGAEFAGTSAPEGWKFDDFEKLKQALAAQLRNGPALLLVKGSRAMRMERVLEIFS